MTTNPNLQAVRERWQSLSVEHLTAEAVAWKAKKDILQCLDRIAALERETKALKRKLKHETDAREAAEFSVELTTNAIRRGEG